MTELLEKAVETARHLPAKMQDDIARMVLSLAGDDESVIQLTAAEEASLKPSIQQSKDRQFATEDQVRAVWAKHGL